MLRWRDPTALEESRQCEPSDNRSSEEPCRLPAREIAYILDEVPNAAIPQTLRKILDLLSGVAKLAGDEGRLLFEFVRRVLDCPRETPHRLGAAPLLFLCGSLQFPGNIDASSAAWADTAP